MKRSPLMTLTQSISIAAVLLGGSQIVSAQDCDRSCLENYAERYLDAVVDNTPDALPIAPDTQFTEDGVRLPIGEGLWNTMKAKGSYRLFVTDVPAQQVTLIASIFEDHRDPAQSNASLLALRLKIDDQQISQIEQIVVRDDAAARRVEAMAGPRQKFLQTVPARNRMSRADLISQSNKYFTGMQQNDGMGDYPFTDDCHRIENGSQATNAPTPEGQTRPDPKTAMGYSGQWTCTEQFKSGLLHFVHSIRDRRFVAVDEERGLTFVFAFFDHPGGDTRTFTVPDGRTVTAGPTQPWTWQLAEIFQLENGKISQIEAILHQVPYGMNSGWSTWEQGMSDSGRDATME